MGSYFLSVQDNQLLKFGPYGHCIFSHSQLGGLRKYAKERFAFYCLSACNLFEENVMSTPIGGV